MPKDELQLNPGPRRQKRGLTLKCLCISCCILTTLCVAVIILFLFLGFITIGVRQFFTPHRSIYLGIPIEDVENRTEIVQPLVNRQQTFDLVATVWARTSQDVLHANGKQPVEGAEFEQGDKESQAVEEEPLFSDVIFHEVRLQDKDLRTTVNFTVPTKLFRHRDLTNYDLRASVMLIPTSPSLLDHMTGYSSYIPSSLKVLPVRPRILPHTLAEKALESFASSVPLIQFHDTRSRCTTTDANSIMSNPSGSPSKTTAATSLREVASKPKLTLETSTSSLEVTRGEDPLKKHPYIVTRTQIRVLDEENIFNLTTFVKYHNELKKIACGEKSYGHSNQFACKQLYHRNGNWETLLQLDVPIAQSGEEKRREWAYAPFFYLSRYGLGPKDLLEVPISRENCSMDQASNNEEPATIDVTWQVSYTGRTPAKMKILDSTEFKTWYKFDTTEAEMAQTHDLYEMLHGVVGHKYIETSHPRRRWLAAIFINLCTIIIWLLDIVYWLTRTSTVSLSKPGTTMLALSTIITQLNSFITRGSSDNPFWISFGNVVLLIPMALIRPIAQLKTIYRVSISFNHWIPTLRREPVTRSERISERLESQTGGKVQGSLFLCALAIYYFFPPHKMVLIAATIEMPKADTTKAVQIPPFIANALRLVGTVLQIHLNWRSHSFAGRARIAAFLDMFRGLVTLTPFIPAMVGTHSNHVELLAGNIIHILFAFITLWQALALPLPQDRVEEDHGE